jgi:hypothetical protein
LDIQMVGEAHPRIIFLYSCKRFRKPFV